MSRLDELAERVANEERTKKAIKILTTKYDEKTRRYLMSVYEDQSLHDTYNAIRQAVELNKSVKDSRRLVVKYPNMIVYKFLDDVFSPKYGSEWATDKDILKKVLQKEDLIQPWKIGNL